MLLTTPNGGQNAYAAALFDLDVVVADADALDARAWQALLEKLLPAPVEDLNSGGSATLATRSGRQAQALSRSCCGPTA
jgi:beta-phosphoglucomutase-like phosphatase (HAD superfamily)